jgi:hypothetical protein
MSLPLAPEVIRALFTISANRRELDRGKEDPAIKTASPTEMELAE